MQTILIVNPKGGSGKSTLATNVAAWVAVQGKKVVLADMDPQGSSNDWLAVRPADRAKIIKGAGANNSIRVDKSTEVLVIDSPAGLHGNKLATFIRNADCAIMPITPSPLDTRAAEHFFEELVSLKSKINKKIKIATVANRVREDTLAAVKLEYYLEGLKLPNRQTLPFLSVLRASQNYIRAAEQGLSIFELAPSKTCYDQEQWQPVLRWLKKVQGQ